MIRVRLALFWGQTRMLMTEQQADQIAHLLNTRNELVLNYNKLRVLQCSDNYLIRCDNDGNVMAFIEVVKVQWYQTELRHLTVAEGHERQGHARGLIQEAEDIARSQRRGILQCTIRESNVRSRDVF